MNRKELSDECERFAEPKLPLSRMRKLISSLRFFPKTHDFFYYFEKSAKNIVEGSKMLCSMMENIGEREALVEKLKDCEHEGDKTTHEVIDLLRQTFLTPFDRSDMYHLIVKLDDILDIVFYIGNRLTRYNITKMPKEVGKLASIVLESAEELSRAIAIMNNMKNSRRVLDHCIEINSLENKADEQVNVVIEELFGGGWDAIDIIKIKELVENLEAAADKCEDVANIIEGIILKHA